MKCEDCKELLVELVYDEISDDHRRLVERHLRECPDCARELDEMVGTLAAIREMPEPEPPPFVNTRLKANAQEAASVRRPVWSFLKRPWVAVAAVAVIAASTVVVMKTAKKAEPAGPAMAIEEYAMIDRDQPAEAFRYEEPAWEDAYAPPEAVGDKGAGGGSASGLGFERSGVDALAHEESRQPPAVAMAPASDEAPAAEAWGPGAYREEGQAPKARPRAESPAESRLRKSYYVSAPIDEEKEAGEAGKIEAKTNEGPVEIAAAPVPPPAAESLDREVEKKQAEPPPEPDTEFTWAADAKPPAKPRKAAPVAKEDAEAGGPEAVGVEGVLGASPAVSGRTGELEVDRLLSVPEPAPSAPVASASKPAPDESAAAQSKTPAVPASAAYAGVAEPAPEGQGLDDWINTPEGLVRRAGQMAGAGNHVGALLLYERALEMLGCPAGVFSKDKAASSGAAPEKPVNCSPVLKSAVDGAAASYRATGRIREAVNLQKWHAAACPPKPSPQ